MKKPRVMVIPFPAQGHVLPLMTLSQYLAHQGIQITFINTQSNHNRIIDSINNNCNFIGDRIDLVSIPDGLEDSPADKNIPGKLSESVLRLMPTRVEQLIEENRDSINCVLADQSLGWAIEIASKFGIKRAAFCPAAAASMVLGLNIQKLVDDGIIDADGTPRVNKRIKLSEGMPEIKTTKFVWICQKNKQSKRNVFELMVRSSNSVQLSDWFLCNSVYELESDAFGLCPRVQPIGPISLAYGLDDFATSAGSFWVEERDCLDWLDRQESGSVIYIAFGSFGFMGLAAQLEELAMGLELTNRPVLWAIGSNQTFIELVVTRPLTRTKVVTWAPQRTILKHRGIGCFVSHCGWNSTMEGASNGVPFLCWPMFADQFINMTYICQLWKTGLALEIDKESGMVLRTEIKEKVDEVMENGKYKKRALEVKDIVMASVEKGGNSYENLEKFVEWLKECS